MKFRAVESALTTCMVILVSVMPGLAAGETASEVVRNTSSQVIERLVAQKAQLEAEPEQIYDVINELVLPHFDFYNMSRFVLGNAWNQANKEQQQAFVEQFKTLLVRTYANALKQYSDNEIKYFPEQSNPDSRLVLVKTEVKGVNGTKSVPINYRMHSVDGAWKVVDVAVDGVSLVSTYRGSFASEIRNSGMDALIAKLVERNLRITVTRKE